MHRMIGATGQSPVKTAALHPGRPFLPGTSEQTQENRTRTPQGDHFGCVTFSATV